MSTLSFWGAAGTVTGSKYLIETDRARVLVDCGLFQGGHELRDRNRHKITKHLPALPLYTEQDARETLKLLQVVPNNGQEVRITKGITAEFRIAGHILGSSQVAVRLNDEQTRTVVFSGDLGKYDQPIIRDPVAPPACDYLLVESTYGDRLHDVEHPKDALDRIIRYAASRNGPGLIPEFAVGCA